MHVFSWDMHLTKKSKKQNVSVLNQNRNNDFCFGIEQELEKLSHITFQEVLEFSNFVTQYLKH